MKVIGKCYSAKKNYPNKKFPPKYEVLKVLTSSEEKHIEIAREAYQRGLSKESVLWFFCDSQPIGCVPNNLHNLFPNLQVLTLNCCSIEKISRENLQGLETINTLSFGHNRLTSLPDDLFVDMNHLISIDFRGNPIEFVSSKLLTPIEDKLRFACFKDTYITESFDIQSETGNGLESLKEALDARKKDYERLLRKRKPDELSNSNVFVEVSELTIKALGKEFKIRKSIAQSSIFGKMFTDDIGQASKLLNNIKNNNEEILNSFLEYFNSGTIEESVNAEKMLELAVAFDVLALKSICEARILNKVDEANAIEVFNIAHRHQSSDLKKKSFEIIKKMFPGLNNSFENKLCKVNELAALKAETNALKEKMEALMK